MKRHIFTCACSAVVLVFATASAQDSAAPWYAGFTLGISKTELDQSFTIDDSFYGRSNGTAEFGDGSSPYLALHVGRRLGEAFAIEVENFGTAVSETTISTVSESTTTDGYGGLTVNAVRFFELSPRYRLSAAAGIGVVAPTADSRGDDVTWAATFRGGFEARLGRANWLGLDVRHVRGGPIGYEQRATFVLRPEPGDSPDGGPVNVTRSIEGELELRATSLNLTYRRAF